MMTSFLKTRTCFKMGFYALILFTGCAKNTPLSTGNNRADAIRDAETSTDANSGLLQNEASDLKNTIGSDLGSDTIVDSDSQNEDARTDVARSTWTDSHRGLMWQVTPNEDYMVWQDAKEYCGFLSLGGYDDWRLPNIEELISLIRGCVNRYDTGDFSLSTCEMMPPGCGATDSCSGRGAECSDDYHYDDCGYSLGPGTNGGYWPAEVEGRNSEEYRADFWSSSSNISYGDGAWRVSFSYGYVDSIGKDSTLYVRCVRSER